MSLDPKDVCAVLVTIGDVDLRPIVETLPYGEIVVWDNSTRPYDARVFGRYLGILETRKPVIFFQDDDCIVRNHEELLAGYEPGAIVANMRDDPARLSFFSELGMVLLGWGCLFDRDLPWQALTRYARYHPPTWDFLTGNGMEVCFPMLTPGKAVVTPIEWLRDGPGGEVFARANRMSQQPGFYEEREALYERLRDVRTREIQAGWRR